MVAVLMVSAKLATLSLLKTKKYFGNSVIISLHDDTNKMLSCDSNYIADVIMWLKFGNSSISIWEGCNQKNHALKVLHQWGKRMKTKLQNVLGDNSYAWRSYRGKAGRGNLFGFLILNRVKICQRFPAGC